MQSESIDTAIVYFSSAGSTHRVAEFIGDAAVAEAATVETFNLARPDQAANLEEVVKIIETKDCLVVGSPVYALHAVPIIMHFLEILPNVNGKPAILFVTYGQVNSGTALHEMAQVLSSKGYRVAGAAKVLAQHSMLWQSENPLGQGHPDASDRGEIEQLVKAVFTKIKKPQNAKFLLPEDLNYQPLKIQEIAPQRGIAALRQIIPPMKLDEEACTQCGICADNCPEQNIKLEPSPKFGDTCIFCFNCVRICEPAALSNDIFKFIEADLRKKANEFGEPARSRIWI